MPVSDSLPKKRLKIKFSSKSTEYEPKTGPCESSQQMQIYEDLAQNISLIRKKEFVMNKSHKAAPSTSQSLTLYGADSFKAGSNVQSSSKRGPLGVIDSSMNKRQKMDRSVKRHCGCILEALIKHPAARGFNEPVDPEKLNIPDYFSVVSRPMDLGTVRSKLQDNMYFTVEEFKDDVRLTFSNAMLYNPSDNIFHRNAKKLDSIFDTKWKSLEAKLKHESLNREQSCLSSLKERNSTETKHLCPKRSPLHGESAPKLMIYFSSEKKRKPAKDLAEGMVRNMTKSLKMSDARAANESSARNINSNCSGKVLQKGIVSGNRRTCSSVKNMASLSMVATRCHSCGSLKCQCSLQNGSAYVSSRNSPSERCIKQRCDPSNMEKKSSLTSNICKSDPDSSEPVSVLDGENICCSPQASSPGTTDAPADGWTSAIDLQLSPKKALRAAMLKRRFADTILKAKQKTLLDHDNKVDPVKLQQEKEKLERQQQEEKARIEAQIRNAQFASSMKAQQDLRLRREREREAARIALQKMEKTVEFENNLNILKELDMFSQSMSSNYLSDGSDTSEVLLFETGQGSGRFGNILERLGLFMKDDYMDYED